MPQGPMETGVSSALEKEKGSKTEAAVDQGPCMQDRVASTPTGAWIFLAVSLLPMPQDVQPDRLSSSRLPWLVPLAEMSWCHPKKRPL